MAQATQDRIIVTDIHQALVHDGELVIGRNRKTKIFNK
jgi:hypothetical protein